LPTRQALQQFGRHNPGLGISRLRDIHLTGLR
jgi:hypothetical protein